MQIVGRLERVDAAQDARIGAAISAGTPIIITGLVDRWAASRRWSAAHLVEQVGSAPIEYRRSPSSVHPQIDPDGTMQQRPNERGTLRDYLEQMAQSPCVFLDANLVCLASRRGRVNHELAALLADIERPAFLDAEDVDTIGLWLSGRGVKTRLHYDRNGRHNFNAQISGRKDVVLVPPTEIDKLYPFPISSPTYNFTRVDHRAPDITRYPLFSAAAGLEGTLEAGELLFLPAFWYHAFTHRGDFNLNVNYWTDAASVSLGPASLRNELAIVLLASIPAQERDDPRWTGLMQAVDERCLRWSRRRPTIDEILAGSE